MMVDFSDGVRRTSRPLIPLHDPLAATANLVRRLGHAFGDHQYLEQALTHTSFRNERLDCQSDNQRLEFLGDAVLGLVITEALVEMMPERREGQLTLLKSQLVRESCLAEIAENIGLGPALRLGRGEDQNGGRKRPSILADALEAVIAAIFMDGGYAAVRPVVRNLFDDLLHEAVTTAAELGNTPGALSAGVANWKTAVQELLQQLGHQPPSYTVVSFVGPSNLRRFRVQATAFIDNDLLTGEGEGANKKFAEHVAAGDLYQRLVTMTGRADADPMLAALIAVPTTRPSGLRPRPPSDVMLPRPVGSPPAVIARPGNGGSGSDPLR